MREDFDAGADTTVPVWAVFGDLMAVLLGAFVLVLVAVIGLQLELSAKLENEVEQRQVEQKRRETLEQELAGPLASGRVTLVDGRIGISGSVLFALNSAELQPEGREVLISLIEPLSNYLKTRGEVLMVSGFTDDQVVRGTNRRFADNWDLSAQRALTVTRVLIEEGIEPDAIFAAAFGATRPVSSNDEEEGRARNRRVEIAPVPRPSVQPTESTEPTEPTIGSASNAGRAPNAGDTTASGQAPNAGSASPSGQAPNAVDASAPGQAPNAGGAPGPGQAPDAMLAPRNAQVAP